MKKNMGSVDRVVRILVAIAIAGLYFANLISGTVAIVLLIFAGVFILTSFMSVCPLYYLSEFQHERKKSKMGFLHKHKLAMIGIIAGAIGGYLYYHFIGCATGTCAITSKPLNSTLYGAMMGGLLFNMFQKEKTKTQ